MKALTISRADKWSEGDSKRLRAVNVATVAELRAEVESGVGQLWHIRDEESVVCSLVLRVENGVDGADGVVVAAGGGLSGVDLTADCLPYIESLFSGVRRVRIHTARPGLVKKLKRQGYELGEMVLYKGRGGYGRP